MGFVVLDTKNWIAKLDLRLQQRAEKSILVERKHEGPLRIQKPFYPEGERVCHLYVLHPPGGVVGGDQLVLNISLEEEAFALVTTPGATKFYRSQGARANSSQTFHIASKASLEWMPQETIYFSGCQVTMKTLVHLDKDAQFSGWEISCFGQPASKVLFDKGICHQNFELYREGKPQFLDRNKIEGAHEILTAHWGLQNHSAHATFLITPASETMLKKAKKTVVFQTDLTQNPEGLISATLIDDVLIFRALSNEAEWIKKKFCDIWNNLRPMTIKREAHLPRIWST